MADPRFKPQPAAVPLQDADPPSDSAQAELLPALRYLAAFAMTVFATLLAVGIDTQVKIPNLSLLFVVPVIVAAVSLGLGPSLCSAILGALAYDFFLTEPRYSLTVDDPANVWAIALLFVVGLIVSSVSFTSRRRAADVALLRRQSAVLQGYGRDIVAADDTKAIVSTTSKALAALFHVPVVVVLVQEDKVVSVHGVGNLEPAKTELEAARSALATGRVSPAGVYPALASRYDFWPVATRAGQSAAVGLAFDPDERPSAPATVVDIVVHFLALALERQHLRAGT